MHTELRGELTWRLPVPSRLSLAGLQALVTAVAAVTAWLMLGLNGPAGIAVAAVAVPAWARLAFRAWTVSAALSADTLVIRNVLSTGSVALADISLAGFSPHRRVLQVSESRVPAPGRDPGSGYVARHRAPVRCRTVSALRIGQGAWLSGAWCAADEAADMIRRAAGLPPLPPRRERVSRRAALVKIVGGTGIFACCVGVSGLLPLPPEVGAFGILGAMQAVTGTQAEVSRRRAGRRT